MSKDKLKEINIKQKSDKSLSMSKMQFNPNDVDTDIGALSLNINDNKVNDHEVDLILSDKKDILLTALLKYFCEREKYKYLNNGSQNEDITSSILDALSRLGLIRPEINKDKYDYVRDDILWKLKKMVETSFVKKHLSGNELIHLHEVNNIYRNFKLRRIINSGAYGIVYEAQSLTDNKCYAIKRTIYNPIKMKKWNSEVTIMSKLNHENIIKYHSSWLDYSSNIPVMESMINDNNDSMNLLIQMELCDTDLSYIIKNYSYENRKTYIHDIFNQILNGVKYIHESHIVHRDLKPSNILIKFNGDDFSIKITDFGCATENDANNNNDIYPSSRFIGTKNYVAPEIENNKAYNNKCDIYSLGCILSKLMNNVNDNIINKLISDMLNIDYDKRPSIDMLIQRWNSKSISNIFRL